MGRTAWQTLFTMDGTLLKRLLDYGQGHISTLFSMDGSAPKHSSLWAGPHRAFITMGGPHRDIHYYGRVRSGPALLWAGPRQYRTGPAPGPHYYGRARTGRLITMGGPAAGRIPMGGPAFLWAGPPHRFRPYKVISKRCEEDGLLHNAKLLPLIFTNQITLYLRPAPKRCFTTHFVCIRFLRVSLMF